MSSPRHNQRAGLAEIKTTVQDAPTLASHKASETTQDSNHTANRIPTHDENFIRAEPDTWRIWDRLPPCMGEVFNTDTSMAMKILQLIVRMCPNLHGTWPWQLLQLAVSRVTAHFTPGAHSNRRPP
jgi:hypothetical protein